MTKPSAPRDPRRASRSIPVLPPATLAGIVVAVAAVALIGLFTFRSLQAREEAVQRVTHTLLVIERLEALQSTMKDAETGQRGFLLIGEERYLEPYANAKAGLPAVFNELRTEIASVPAQLRRVATLEQLSTEKMAELAQTIELRRAGKTFEALEIVRTDRGRAAMDRFRALIAEAENEEGGLLATYEAQWQTAVTLSSLVTSGGSILLLALLGAGAVLMSRDYRSRETEAWVRSGQAGLSARIQGEQRLETLGDNVLEFLAHYLNAQVGAVFMAESDGGFRRVAGYALAPGPGGDLLRPGDGLLGQAAKENRALHVKDVPEGYLPVASSIGRGTPQDLLVSPASVDGVVHAVIELGFLHTIVPADRDLLARVSESLGVACHLYTKPIPRDA
jgi:CHASE3 domain sensor protein